MNHDTTQGTLDRLMLVSGSLEKLAARLQKQAQEGEAAIRAAREQEERKFAQTMVAMFSDHQQRMEAALRPKTIRAWQSVAVVAGVLVLLFVGGMILMKSASERLHAAQAQADAAEVNAQVLEAMESVELTSCSGRPCIRIDKETPTWKHGNNEYVLVDGQQKVSGARRP